MLKPVEADTLFRMFMRRARSPKKPGRLTIFLVAISAFLLTGSPLSLVDAVLHSHTICLENGQVLHDSPGNEHTCCDHGEEGKSEAPVAVSSPDEEPGSDEASHDHSICWVLATATSLQQPPVPGDDFSMEKSLALPSFTQEHVADRAHLYELAPANSPPTA